MATECYTFADYHGLSPADGWQAVFREPDGTLRRERLIGWAVSVIKERVIEHAEDEDEECKVHEIGEPVDAILGMVARCVVEPAEWLDDFMCYAHASESIEDIDERLSLIEEEDLE